MVQKEEKEEQQKNMFHHVKPSKLGPPVNCELQQAAGEKPDFLVTL